VEEGGGRPRGVDDDLPFALNLSTMGCSFSFWDSMLMLDVSEELEVLLYQCESIRDAREAARSRSFPSVVVAVDLAEGCGSREVEEVEDEGMVGWYGLMM